MAETPKFYMPDLKMMWKPLDITTSWATDTIKYIGGRRQRRGRQNQKIRAYKLMNANALSQENRRAFYDFFNTVQGGLNSFYFWEPSPRLLKNFNCTLAGGPQTCQTGDQRHLIVPIKGPNWLGDPDPAAYATYLANSSALTLGVQIGVPPSWISASGLTAPGGPNGPYSSRPRGNNYATFMFPGTAAIYGNAGTAANTRIAGNQTWAAWVHLKPLDTGSQWVIAGNETINASGVIFYLDATQRVVFRTSQAGANTTASFTPVIPLNTWTHIAVVYSPTSATLYINGVSQQTIGSINAPVSATANLYIGTNPNNPGAGGQQFHGMINDLYILSVALTAPQALALYSGDQSFNMASPFGWVNAHWPITDGHGATTFIDQGANAYNATIVNVSDFQWVGGEDYLIWGSVPTASQFDVYLLGVQNARQRVCATFATDDLPESFLADVVPVDANFDITLLEAV